MKITTLRQFEILVSEMEKNPEYAKGLKKGIKPLNFDSFWKEAAEKINPFGPPVRDGDGWHKVWKDLKFKVKKKLVTNKSEARATGGGINKQISLSSLEEAVANLMQFEKQINPTGDVAGFVEEIAELAVTEEDAPNVYSANLNTESISTNNNEEPPTKKTRTSSNKSNEKERITLLRKQTEVQEPKSKNLESIKSYLKDISRYQKKRLEIEEQRLSIYKRKSEKEIELLNLDAAIKKKTLALLEKQLNFCN